MEQLVKIKVTQTPTYLIKTESVKYLGSDVRDADATPEDVAAGKTFYAQDNGVKKVGELHAYAINENPIDENTVYLRIKTLGKGSVDTTSIINIERYKMQDLQRISKEGGEIATDEEYEDAENEMQKLYSKIMLGGTNE